MSGNPYRSGHHYWNLESVIYDFYIVMPSLTSRPSVLK
jgi:hypothetical protein